MRFTPEPSIGGLAVAGQAACAKAFPALKDLGTWTFFEGELRLGDANRHTLAAFPEDEGGFYETQRKDGTVWRLIPLDVPPPLTEAEQMAGVWLVLDQVPEAAATCRYDFKSAKDGQSGTVAISGKACPAPWAAMRVWKRTGEQLRLSDAAGKTVRTLRRSDPITFDLLGAKRGAEVMLQKHFD